MIPEIAGGRLLEGPSHLGGGNLLYVVETDVGPRLLKLYRQRRRRWRAPWRDLGHWLEGKRTVGPARRAATEHELLTLWRAQGFDAPAVFDLPLPPGIEGPGLWLEYCPGPTLFDVVADTTQPIAETQTLVARFGAELGRRQALAAKERDARFVHEHASILHVLVHAERLVSFDLEGAWRTRRSLDPLLADELAAVVRSILKVAGDRSDALLRAFGAAYGDDGRLRALIERGLSGGPLRRLKRLRGSARRAMQGKISKPEALRRLRAQIGS